MSRYKPLQARYNAPELHAATDKNALQGTKVCLEHFFLVAPRATMSLSWQTANPRIQLNPGRRACLPCSSKETDNWQNDPLGNRVSITPDDECQLRL